MSTPVVQHTVRGMCGTPEAGTRGASGQAALRLRCVRHAGGRYAKPRGVRVSIGRRRLRRAGCARDWRRRSAYLVRVRARVRVRAGVRVRVRVRARGWRRRSVGVRVGVRVGIPASQLERMSRFGTSALSVHAWHTHTLRVGVRVRGWLARSRCSGVLPVRARARVGLPSPVGHAVQYHEAPPLALRRRSGHAAARAVVRRLRLSGRGLHCARRTCSLVPWTVGNRAGRLSHREGPNQVSSFRAGARCPGAGSGRFLRVG